MTLSRQHLLALSRPSPPAGGGPSPNMVLSFTAGLTVFFEAPPARPTPGMLGREGLASVWPPLSPERKQAELQVPWWEVQVWRSWAQPWRVRAGTALPWPTRGQGAVTIQLAQ